MGSGPGELLKLADLNPGEVTLSRASGGTDLLVKVNATGGAVKVEGHFGAHDGLSEIAFADGTVLGRAQIQQAASIRGTNGGEALAGSWESETLDGGRGDDTLSGSYGADTYVYRPGDGNDLIVEHWYSWEEAQANALKLLGLSAAEVTLARAGDELRVTVNATGKTVTVERHFAAHDGLARIDFADGASFDRGELQQAARFRGTAAAEALVGSGENDTLDGHQGDDTLTGSYGANTYVHRAGDGSDRIVEHHWPWDALENDALKLVDLDAADITLSRASNGTDLLVRVDAIGETIIVERHFASPSSTGRRSRKRPGSAARRRPMTSSAPAPARPSTGEPETIPCRAATAPTLMRQRHP